MNKKFLRIITIVATIIVVMCISTAVFADEDPSKYTGKTITEFNNIGNTIIGALKAIGTIISVAVLIIIGIKYMMGSAEEKAEYKKTMIPYLIGAVIIFVAPYIAGAIYSFATTSFGNSSGNSGS